MVPVDHGGGFAVAHYFELRYRILDPVLDDTVIVDGFEPADTVRIDAALVGGNQDFGASSGISVGDAHSLENIYYKSFQQITRYPGMGYSHFVLLPRITPEKPG
jgi:hypothetical protein